MVSPVHGDYRRCQAEIPLIILFRFPGPALIVGAQSIYMQGAGYAWMPEDDDGPARFWLQGNSEPLRLDGMRIHSKDNIVLSDDQRRALVISDEGIGDLWA